MINSTKMQLIKSRLGHASPIVLAAGYTLVRLCFLALSEVLPESITSGFDQIAWAVTVAVLFVVITWFRDDDWLSVGFLIALTVYLGDMVILVLGSALQSGSVGPAIIGSITGSFRTLLFAVVGVPIAGGIIALARKLGQSIPRRQFTKEDRSTLRG